MSWRQWNNVNEVDVFEDVVWVDAQFPNGEKRNIKVGKKLVHNTCGGTFIQKRDYDEGMPDAYTVRWTCDKCGHKQVMDGV